MPSSWKKNVAGTPERRIKHQRTERMAEASKPVAAHTPSGRGKTGAKNFERKSKNPSHLGSQTTAVVVHPHARPRSNERALYGLRAN